MRVKLGLAIVLSLVLIGAASWSRFFDDNPTPGTLALESSPAEKAEFSKLLEAYLANSTSTSSTSTSTDTMTVQLGRGLLVDFINLSTSGDATQEKLTDLAQRYVDSIPVLESSRKISVSDLNVVASTQINLKNYSTTLIKVESDYRKEVDSKYSGSPYILSGEENLYKNISGVASIYAGVAEKLQSMPVPNQVAEHHVKLVNYYLDAALSMHSISQGYSDAVVGLAGLSKLQSILSEETAILNSISVILEINGI